MDTNWLLAIRKSKRMTQTEIAKNAGITRPYYTMIESGKRRPSVETAQRIANTLGFDWTSFFRHSGSDTLPPTSG